MVSSPETTISVIVARSKYPTKIEPDALTNSSVCKCAATICDFQVLLHIIFRCSVVEEEIIFIELISSLSKFHKTI
ncbi:unnamed protein product [Rotaria sordida]|uniref:Uncharacterized protein n=1 Tax=Rotaria sordida TaxID=392033 RepID=A0A819ICA8_9BILA|nr:unnamed protein product [Rotaria sordida]CAF3911506.1 unnamed protein product [Rotaria sordida]